MAEHRIETADGVQIVECLRGGDRYSEDCPQCNKTKEKEIKKWVDRHEPFCILCDEKPKCYVCLKKGCEQWLKDKSFIEDYGTYRGCPRLVLNMYCEDFVCKHKFIGWWRPEWKKRFKKVRFDASDKIRKKRKEDQQEKKHHGIKTKAKKQDKPVHVRPAKKKHR